MDMARAAGVHVHSCNDPGCQRGFPDLVLIGRRGVLYRELKVPPDDLTREQRVIGYRLTASGQDYAVWTEADLASGLVWAQVNAIY